MDFFKEAKPGTLKGYSLLGVVLIFGFMLGYSSFRHTNPVYFKDKVLPVLIGTLGGALLAFQIKRVQDAHEEEKRQRAAGNLAMFTLVMQMNDLLQNEMVLKPWRHDSVKVRRWFELKPIISFSELPAIRLEELGWLLETEDRNILGRVLAARNGYLAVNGLLKIRHQIKEKVNDYLEEKLKNEKVEITNGEIPWAFLKKHLTDRQNVELKESAEQLLSMNLDVFHDHFEVMADLHKAMKKIWPGRVLIAPEPKEGVLEKVGLSLPPPSEPPATTLQSNDAFPRVHRFEVNED
ncbi:MAG TPA: hypothetical protein VJ486_07005 [Geothrix sp.]|nr:hypothetical protein [Geothrix sp.]